MDVSEELLKEVFAHFGAAYYHSEVLHKGLCNAYATMTFEDPHDITRPRLEEKFARAYSLTLGQLIAETKDLFTDELQSRLATALEKRNFLAHHYWFDRSPLMFNENGLMTMREELQELTELFNALDEEITEYFKYQREWLGITDEVMQESMNRLIAGELEEPFISQRPLKKQERIVRAWDVKVADDLIAQIFETDDGCLWQLCDIGLGWTRFTEPKEDWKANAIIQKHLPVSINPRPSVSEPWNYEFRLAKGAVLSVKRGKRERSYTWSIEESA